MANWPATGDTDWNTKMLAYLAIEHNTNGTHKAAEVTAVVTGEGIFGKRTQNDTTPAAIAKDVIYRAAGDGILTITKDHTNDTAVVCYTDDTNPPTVVMGQYATSSITDKKMTLTIPIIKLDYVKITSSHATNDPDFYWTPIGSGGLVDQTP